MTTLRRVITVPLVTTVMVLMLALGPLLLLGTGVVGLLLRSSRPPRTVALTMAYAVIELRTLLQVLRGNRDCDQLMRDILVSAHLAMRRILDVTVELESGSATADTIPRDQPLIVLSRHCGPGDSVVVAWLLAVEYRLQLRIVLKGLLRCEPVLDLAGGWGCLCFLRRGERARRQIRSLAASLEGGQAMLLFPEGANFSWPRWRSAITRLRSTGGLRAARDALRQSHTLPPRSGGASAAVAGAPKANLLVLAHNGFCADGRARPWWQVPVHRQLLIRTVVVPAGEVPSPERLEPWLEQTWSRVDAWVAAHAEQ
ncbi:acyltransferase [Mycobacteriaceae bacterium 1482268.1]|nr:acyltransferase [Mycobacteriaceae bacterium 1482268.1]